MRIFMRVIAILCLSGCWTATTFTRERNQLTDLGVCHAVYDAEHLEDAELAAVVSDEVQKRGLTRRSCNQLLDEEAQVIGLAIAVGVAAAAAGVATGVAANSGGTYTASPPLMHYYTSDHEWDWDLFYNEDERLVWACRGIQTGQFAPLANCPYWGRADTRWPSLQAP